MNTCSPPLTWFPTNLKQDVTLKPLSFGYTTGILVRNLIRKEVVPLSYKAWRCYWDPFVWMIANTAQLPEVLWMKRKSAGRDLDHDSGRDFGRKPRAKSHITFRGVAFVCSFFVPHIFLRMHCGLLALRLGLGRKILEPIESVISIHHRRPLPRSSKSVKFHMR